MLRNYRIKPSLYQFSLISLQRVVPFFVLEMLKFSFLMLLCPFRNTRRETKMFFSTGPSLIPHSFFEILGYGYSEAAGPQSQVDLDETVGPLFSSCGPSAYDHLTGPSFLQSLTCLNSNLCANPRATMVDKILTPFPLGSCVSSCITRVTFKSTEGIIINVNNSWHIKGL